MKKLLLTIIIGFWLIPSQGQAAIAFDTISGKGQNNTTSVTQAMTIGAISDGLLLVSIVYQAATDDVTGVTWNGDSMTKLINGAWGNNNNEQIYIYGLLNPDTGSHNIVVSKTGASTFVTFYGLSYSGVSQSGLPDAIDNSTGGLSTGAAVSVTTVADNAWLSGVFRASGGSSFSDDVNTTERDSFADASCFVQDTNSDQTPAGSKTMNLSWTGNETWGWAAVSFAPVSEAVEVSPSIISDTIFFE